MRLSRWTYVDLIACMNIKVLYAFGGIPPYYDATLRTLARKGVDISVMIPKGKGLSLGQNVKLIDDAPSCYKVIQAEEKRAILGKPYFPRLPAILLEERPNIVVMGWPYFLQFFFQPALRKAIKATNTKLVIREIPFRVPPYGAVSAFFKEHRFFDEGMRLLNEQPLFLFRQWVLARIRRYCYRRADGALAYATVGKEIMPTYGIAADKVFVTYNANDTDELFAIKQRLTEAGTPQKRNPHRVIHVGRLVKWKRVDLLMETFAKVLPRFPEAELVIIGDGPELEPLKQQAAALNLTGKVLFTGAIYDYAQIASYLTSSAVYTLAGMGGLSINDAMTFGLPVICSVCDGTERDLVIDGENGFFFKENDADDLAAKLTILFEEPERAVKMGKAAWKVIRDKVNLDTVSERYIHAFCKIVSGNRMVPGEEIASTSSLGISTDEQKSVRPLNLKTSEPLQASPSNEQPMNNRRDY
jgi:glycosyltransferase involved in cell wall biosynthesis